jgi:hypothetical protein
LSVRHSLRTEATGALTLYGVYELSRGLAVTAGVLLWLHRRHPEGFPYARTALLLASGLALVGFLVYPTAPPRLAGVGILDTVSGRHVDLDRGVVSSLFNPYAAVPSMHIGYALLVAMALVRHGRGVLVRAIGALYPPFVLLVIVATGNHFFLDAAAGAAVAAVAAALAALLTPRPATTRFAAEQAQTRRPRRPPQRLSRARARMNDRRTLFAVPPPRAWSRHPRPAEIRHERIPLVRRPPRSPRDATADRPLR